MDDKSAKDPKPIDWREHHATQPYAEKHSYEELAPAYRTAHAAFEKHGPKGFEEIEDDIALDYQKHEVGSALPWDKARPAVRSAWDKLSGVVGPRDTDRGIRSGF